MTKQDSKANTSMHYRLNRYKKKRHNNVSFLGVSGLISIFIILMIIGSNPEIQQAINERIEEERYGGDSNYYSDITINTIYGGSINLASHQGKVVIVFFFGINCPGCPEQAAILRDIDNIYSNSQVYIVPICLDSAAETSDSQLQAFINNYQSSWPVVRDTITYTYASYFNIQYKPTVKILNQEGYIVATMVGTTQGSFNNIKNQINALL